MNSDHLSFMETMTRGNIMNDVFCGLLSALTTFTVTSSAGTEL